MTRRLVKVAKEFKIGTGVIVDLLARHGYVIDQKPTSKISEEMYELLKQEFEKQGNSEENKTVLLQALNHINELKENYHSFVEDQIKKIEEMETYLYNLKNGVRVMQEFIDIQCTMINKLSERITPDFDFPEIDLKFVRLEYIESKGEIDWGNFGQGLLSASGYHVGKTRGLTESERREILNFIFLKDTLNDIDNEGYKEQWGEPKTSDRLKKLADVVATLANNALRKRGDYSKAIWDWHSDLQYLKKSFYDNWGGFPWPKLERKLEE